MSTSLTLKSGITTDPLTTTNITMIIGVGAGQRFFIRREPIGNPMKHLIPEKRIIPKVIMGFVKCLVENVNARIIIWTHRKDIS